MWRFLRALLAGVGKLCGWGVALADEALEGVCRGVREALWPPAPPAPLGVGEIVEAMEARETRGVRRAASAAKAAAVREAPTPAPVAADRTAERAVQDRALRYATAVMRGQDRPSLDGLPQPLARKLGRLGTPVAMAPVWRELVRATGRECRDGWWTGRPDAEPGGGDPTMAAGMRI